MRILLIEDSNDLSFLVKEALSDSYVVDIAENLSIAHYLIDTEDYNLLILDLSFPDGNGLDFCKKIRNEGFKTPILFLTGDRSLDSKISSFKNGANDYLTKPFNLSELEVRILALVRKKENILLKDLSVFGDLEVDYQIRAIKKNGCLLKLSKKEFLLFDLFLKNPKKIFNKKQIAALIWENSDIVFSNSIESHISSLRRKLGKKRIETIRGIGYRLA